LADCYFVLALIHDAERRDAGRISRFGPDEGNEPQSFSKDDQEWTFWYVMAKDAAKLSVSNGVTLDDCLARVEADLSESEGSPRENGGRRRRRGRPADRNAAADKRVAEAWAEGGYQTYEALAIEMGKTEREVKLAIDAQRQREKRKRSPGSHPT
jgi:hypothetical protein